MKSLVVERVTKQWPGKMGLADVSFEAVEGTLTAVIGPSGAGKTTLLKVVAGISSFDSGEVRRGAAQPVMVFQEDSLWPHMTLLDNVTCPLRILQGIRRVDAEQRASELLTDWGLGKELKNYPAELSGGQRQRGALARAWLTNPEILCLDEITSGLDPESTYAILKNILKLKATSTTLLIVTHQLSFARATADRVLFLDGGKLIADGTAQEVLSKPDHPRIEAFLSAFDYSGG